MSSIVADELAKIKSFETDTEKRRSELTLNELNYISDKQLHKKDSGGSGPVEWDFFAEIITGGLEPEINLLVGDFQTYYNKFSNESEIPVIGLMYDFSTAESMECKITGTIAPSTFAENAIQFMIIPIESPDPSQFWTLIWSPDNSLELDTPQQS